MSGNRMTNRRRSASPSFAVRFPAFLLAAVAAVFLGWLAAIGTAAAQTPEEPGIEIGPDTATPPRPPAPPRGDTMRGRPSTVPVPPAPPAAGPPTGQELEEELARAREQLAREQERLEHQREQAEEALDRAQEAIDRERHIRPRAQRGEDPGSDRGEIVRMGQDVVIEAGDAVEEVVVIGGDLEVRGQVEGDAVAVGGNVTLGPGAMVGGDAVSVGGSLDIDPGAIVEGDEVEVGGSIGPGLGGWPGGLGREEHRESRVKQLGKSILMLLILLFMGWLAAVLAGDRLSGLADAMQRDWLRSLAAGVLVLVLWLPAVFLSAITVIGIPVAIFLILAVPLVAFIGYLAGAMALGRRISVGIGRPVTSPLRSLLLGIAIIGVLAVFGRIVGLVGFLGPFGFAFRMVSWALFSFAAITGLGAIAMVMATRFRSRAARPDTPPMPPPTTPLPPEPPAPPAPPAPPVADFPPAQPTLGHAPPAPGSSGPQEAPA
jgi:hypothetical protein